MAKAKKGKVIQSPSVSKAVKAYRERVAAAAAVKTGKGKKQK